MNDDEAIRVILQKILGKWNINHKISGNDFTEPVAHSQEKPKSKSAYSSTELENDNVIPETIIISPNDEKKMEKRSYNQTTLGQPVKDNKDVMPETIIVSGNNNEKISEIKVHKKDRLPRSEIKKTTKQKADDILTETIILKPDEFTDKDKNGRK